VGRRDIEERSKQHPVTHRYLLLSYMHTQSIHTGYPDIPERPSRSGVLAPAMLCACHRAPGWTEPRRMSQTPAGCVVMFLLPLQRCKRCSRVLWASNNDTPPACGPSTSSIPCVRENGRGTSHNTEHTHPPSPLCPCVPLGFVGAYRAQFRQPRHPRSLLRSASRAIRPGLPLMRVPTGSPCDERRRILHFDSHHRSLRRGTVSAAGSNGM
jgi:hypothetical protein